MNPRYLIGIDLGTSNSALAYVDTLDEDPCSRIFRCPQWQNSGIKVEYDVLPSFFYIPPSHLPIQPLFTPQETTQSDQRKKIELGVTGMMARGQMALTPGRVVQSTKSWLCHRGADPREPILPWGSEDITLEEKVSPVTVSAAYLAHFRQAWNDSIGRFDESYRFESQDITITVPASFDEVAQRLTLEAAMEAGYPSSVRLLEEPQAAFYHYLESHRDSPGSSLIARREKATVLVCDVGGGTTDFSLFETRGGEETTARRIAVSEHILLGGDNIDLTLAVHFERKAQAQGQNISPAQFAYLLYHSRVLKEKLLSQPAEEQIWRISLPPTGSSSLLRNALTLEISTAEIAQLIFEGFFPLCPANAQPQEAASGLREWGLPFAKDCAITKHLAHFLRGRTVDFVLYTGGTLKPKLLQERLTNALQNWQGDTPLVVLENEAMELGVARGSAFSGLLRRLRSGIIEGGYSRSIYLELARIKANSPRQAVCILPRGTESGKTVELSHMQFEALVDHPVRFQIWYSNERNEKVGELINIEESDLHQLPELQTKLTLTAEHRKSLAQHAPVTLKSEVNELGLLQLYCVHNSAEYGAREWRLDFNLRRKLSESASTDETSPPKTIPEEALKKASGCILDCFGTDKHRLGEANPRHLLRNLEQALGKPKADWDLQTLRALWPSLLQGITRRARSVAHEVAWLTLAGFVLRPGFGSALDAHRLDELWRLFHLGLAFPGERSAQVQWLILWRRVSGGLDKERQTKVFNSVISKVNKKGLNEPESINLAASLERVSLESRIELGKLLVNLVRDSKSSAKSQAIWALQRLGARLPLYGGVESVIPAAEVTRWFSQLESLDWATPENKPLALAFVRMGRLTNDRHLDFDPQTRESLIAKASKAGLTAEQLAPLSLFIEMDVREQNALFGESLPSGIRLSRLFQ